MILGILNCFTLASQDGLGFPLHGQLKQDKEIWTTSSFPSVFCKGKALHLGIISTPIICSGGRRQLHTLLT